MFTKSSLSSRYQLPIRNVSAVLLSIDGAIKIPYTSLFAGIKDLKQKTQDSINDTLNWTRGVSYSWDTNLSTGVNPKTWNS